MVNSNALELLPPEPKIEYGKSQQSKDKKIPPKKTPGLVMNSFGVGFSFIGFVISGVMVALTGSLFQQVMLIWYTIMLLILSFLLGNKLRHRNRWE